MGVVVKYVYVNFKTKYFFIVKITPPPPKKKKKNPVAKEPKNKMINPTHSYFWPLVHVISLITIAFILWTMKPIINSFNNLRIYTL